MLVGKGNPHSRQLPAHPQLPADRRNQTTSRDPITRFTGEEVSEALRGLSEKYLVEKTLGGRAPKFEHCLQDVLGMQPGERAVLTVLLLRGPQSAGEIRRVETFAHLLSSAAADSSSVTGAPPAASDTPAENDWRAAIEARLASLEPEIAELKAGRPRDSSM